jgi:hypothetical protein
VILGTWDVEPEGECIMRRWGLGFVLYLYGRGFYAFFVNLGPLHFALRLTKSLTPNRSR